jgi:signal transduction histidine kinase
VRLAATYGAEENDWDPALVQRACEVQMAVVENRPGHPAVLAIPCSSGDMVFGVLLVVDDNPGRAFDTSELIRIQPLAGMAAAALRQTERLVRTMAEFRALHAIDVALSSSLQLDRVLKLILEKAVELVGAEHGSLRLLSPDTGELVLKSYWGEGWTPEIQAYVFQLGQGITGWVAEQRRPYLCHDAHRDPQNIVLFDQMNSGVAVPLLTRAEHDPMTEGQAGQASGLQIPASLGSAEQEKVLGVLLLESARLGAFGEHDVELLEALAQEAVIAIQNATQHQELQRMYQAWREEQDRRIAAEKWTVMGQAATALAHRINNLIGIVPASAGEVHRVLDKLEMLPRDREWVEANLSRIERNSRFVLNLAEALFRPFQESGPSARFDVNRLLNEALQAASIPPSCQVVREFGQDLPLVESNSLLVDTFLELITNARKAIAAREQPQQQLLLRTWSEAANGAVWVAVQVCDTGGGIPADRMAHLWDMFQPSSDPSEDSAPRGLGFGLWWVRTFVERQGGTITCETEPGAGTVFTVRLPASRP